MAMFLQVILNRCGNGRFRGSSSRFSCGKLSKTYLIAVHLSKLPTAMFHISSESGDSDVELVSCQPRVFHNSCSPTEEPTEETSPFVSNEWSTSTTNRPILLILVGIPGSGKSSFAKKLEAKGW